MLWRACEAETVGRRSIAQSAMHDEPLQRVHYVRDKDEGTTGVSWLAIVESSARGVDGRAGEFGGLDHVS